MNILTTSPVVQYCMQIKDEASTSVNVVSTEDNMQKNTTEFDASVTEMNSTAQYKSDLARRTSVHYACMHECYI